jgi:hypothetical protein
LMHRRANLPAFICAPSSQIGVIRAITSEVGLVALARLLHVGSR